MLNTKSSVLSCGILCPHMYEFSLSCHPKHCICTCCEVIVSHVCESQLIFSMCTDPGVGTCFCSVQRLQWAPASWRKQLCVIKIVVWFSSVWGFGEGVHHAQQTHKPAPQNPVYCSPQAHCMPSAVALIGIFVMCKHVRISYLMYGMSSLVAVQTW